MHPCFSGFQSSEQIMLISTILLIAIIIVTTVLPQTCHYINSLPVVPRVSGLGLVRYRGLRAGRGKRRELAGRLHLRTADRIGPRERTAPMSRNSATASAALSFFSPINWRHVEFTAGFS